MPKKSAVKKPAKKKSAKPKEKAGLAVSLEKIQEVISAHAAASNLPEPRTFAEANHWLKAHQAWIDMVTEVSSQLLSAAAESKGRKTKPDPARLLDYIEKISELTLETAKAQRSTESLTRCFVE